MIPAADRWGPFADGLDHAERVGRLRTLQAIAHLSLGPRGELLVCELRRAETGNVALEYALAGLNSLAPLDRRRILASTPPSPAPPPERVRHAHSRDL